MTVSSSTNRVSYSGNGTLTVFAYTFKVFDESDLTVILRASDGTETVQTITTHYTVSGVGDVGGGNITFVTAPTATQTVVILREQPLTQGLDLVPNDPFPAESLEESFDKLTFMVQQHEEELGRAIKASRTNTITTTEFVESASDRANKVIAFDGSGDLDLTQEIGTFQGNWAASTAYAVRDIVKDTNNNNIYIANTAHTSSGTVPLTGNADIAKWDLLVDAAAATTSANNAATSATAAATSATAAATSATAAATSESNAATSASNASTSETNAAASATNAATSESNAAGSESAAATSETNAATSATSASTSASAAATSATNAATSETAAAASQSAAATSATAAATSATSAATNATNAATSATNASTAQTAAETAQTAAEAAQAAAELAADNFDDTYLGSKSSDPTVDNDGGALNAGDLYFNTTSNTLKVYSGSAWQDAAVDSSGFVQTTGDTMTGNLDVQGTVTSDGLNVNADNTNAPQVVFGNSHSVTTDAAISTYDDAAGVGITLGSNYYLNSAGSEARFNTSEESAGILVDRVGVITLKTDNSGSAVAKDRLNIAGNGDISFYEDTGTTPKFFWDASAESLGIGTSSPSAALDVSTGGSTKAGIFNGNGVDVKHPTLPSHLTLGTQTGSDVKIASVGAYPMLFHTNGSEAMRIDSSGNVGIGTSSPAANLEITQSGNNVGLLVAGGGYNYTAKFESSDAEANIIIEDSNSTNNGNMIGVATNDMYFITNTSERMRIDSSGNLLVGTTDTQPPTNSDVSGIALRSDGKIAASRDNGIAADFNNNNAGNIAWFRKNGTVVATVSTRTGGGDAPYFSGYTNADTGIAFSSARMYPVTSSGVVANGTRDLGNTDARWGNLWLSGGVYLGGTGSANKLDDYEEGTWTPVVRFGTSSTGITYGDQVGRYTKVGRKVTVEGGLNLTARGSATGTFNISGLPFTQTDAGGYSDSSVYFGFIAGTNLSSQQLNGLVQRGTTEIYPREVVSGASANIQHTDLNNNSAFIFTVTYFTTA